MTNIATILRQRVEREEVISFAQFMETALYCPNSGYYEQSGSQIGRAGDFYTSVSVGPLFGELLAFQFSRWLEESETVQVVEAGAHDGQLAADILGWMRVHRPELFGRLSYRIVEPSTKRQAWQRAKLEVFAGKVQWLENLDQLPAQGFRGVLFANELLDAFPVHRLAWDAGQCRWVEWGVGLEEGRFVWRRMPFEDLRAGSCESLRAGRCGSGKGAGPEALEGWDAELARAGFELPAELRAVLPDGFTLEFCPTAAAWLRRAAAALGCGRLLTLDYGWTAEEFLTPGRGQGTLRAYRAHRPGADPLADPGEQDLTAHVNFTHLRRAGEEAGLTTEGLLTQAQFLTRAVAEARLFDRLPFDKLPFDKLRAAEVRQFQTLTHPQHLGRAFRALIQSRSS